MKYTISTRTFINNLRLIIFMTTRKAGFQMSMGFIIAVVFAIILLSLSITWIQDLFAQIGTITHKTTDVAQQQLLQQLAASGKKVGIAAPAVTTWGKGETGSYAIGIKNNDVDSDHTFYVNVYLEAIGGELKDETVAMNYEDAESWLTHPKAKFISAGERDIVYLIIRPSTMGTKRGIYTFTVSVCSDEPGDTTDCHAPATDHPQYGSDTSNNLYGSTAFTLEVKD